MDLGEQLAAVWARKYHRARAGAVRRHRRLRPAQRRGAGLRGLEHAAGPTAAHRRRRCPADASYYAESAIGLVTSPAVVAAALDEPASTAIPSSIVDDVDAESAEQPGFVTVTARADSADDAADLANALVASVDSRVAADQAEDLRAERRSLTEAISSVERDLPSSSRETRSRGRRSSRSARPWSRRCRTPGAARPGGSRRWWRPRARPRRSRRLPLARRAARLPPGADRGRGGRRDLDRAARVAVGARPRARRRTGGRCSVRRRALPRLGRGPGPDPARDRRRPVRPRPAPRPRARRPGRSAARRAARGPRSVGARRRPGARPPVAAGREPTSSRRRPPSVGCRSATTPCGATSRAR